MSESGCDQSRRISESIRGGAARRQVSERVVCVPANHEGPYKGTHVRAFRFRGVLHQVRDWSSMSEKLCSLVRDDNPEMFERVLRIGGARKPLFSHESARFERPRHVGDGIYVEANLAANNHKSLCDEISRCFGYGRELEVELW